MKRITEPYGTKVFVQLFHGGREQFGSGPAARSCRQGRCRRCATTASRGR